MSNEGSKRIVRAAQAWGEKAATFRHPLNPDSEISGARLGLLTGWRNGSEAPDALTQLAEESWVAEIAALALLRGEAGVAMYADRKDGAIALVAGGPKRTIARILVEDGHSASAWAGSVRTATKETCQAAGLDRAPVPEVTDVTLELDDAARSWIAERGYDPKMGARPMARIIQDHIKRPLAEELLFGTLAGGGHVRISVGADGNLQLHPEPTRRELVPLPKH